MGAELLPQGKGVSGGLDHVWWEDGVGGAGSVVMQALHWTVMVREKIWTASEGLNLLICLRSDPHRRSLALGGSLKDKVADTIDRYEVRPQGDWA